MILRPHDSDLRCGACHERLLTRSGDDEIFPVAAPGPSAVPVSEQRFLTHVAFEWP
jgi:hypothetical protein